MPCRCKEKRVEQQPPHVIITESPRPPEPVKPPQEKQVDEIVEKLNQINNQ